MMVGIALLLSFSGPVWYNKRAYRAYIRVWGLLRLARLELPLRAGFILDYTKDNLNYLGYLLNLKPS